jgi:hypothetical protein
MDTKGLAFFSRMRKVSDKLCKSKGDTATITRTTTAINLVTGGSTTVSSVVCPINAVCFPPDVAGDLSPTVFNNQLETLTMADKQLRYVIVTASEISFEPKSLDVVTYPGGDKWEVLGCSPVGPAGAAITYGIGLVKL